MQRPPAYKKFCRICGKAFRTRRRIQTCCRDQECRAERNRRNVKDWAERNVEYRKAYIKLYYLENPAPGATKERS